MKILVLDDEEIYFQFLKIMYSGHEVEYEKNPVAWLDKVELEKKNLNEYNIIFCDFYFDNISMNAFELNTSQYIRKYGFENYLVLFSNGVFSDKSELESSEYFDLVVDKADIEPLNTIIEKCEKSSLRSAWQKRF